MTRKSQLARRGAVIVGIRAGRREKEISEFNKILINTVRNIIRRHYEFFWVREGTLTTTTLTEMPRSVAATPCSHDLVAKIQELVDINHSMSARAIAAETVKSE